MPRKGAYRYPMLSIQLLLSLLLSVTYALQCEPPQPATCRSPISPQEQSITPLDSAVDAAKRWTAGAALAATLAVGTWTFPASAVEVSTKTIQVEVDAPVLFKRLRGEKYQTELLSALRELQDVIGPDAIKVTPPSNVKGAFRDLLSGSGEITLNGQPVDVALLGSEKGEVVIRISNPLLPKVPILSPDKNIPFLSSRGDGAAMTTVAASDISTPDVWDVLDTLWSIFGPDEEVTFATLMNVLGQAYGWDMETPFQDQKFFGGKFGIPIPRAEDKGGPFTYVPTNKDVVGGSSLSLAVIYAAAYAYHNAVNEYEDTLAQKKQKERAEKVASTKAEKEKSEAKAAEAAKKEAEEAAAKIAQEKKDSEVAEAAKKKAEIAEAAKKKAEEEVAAILKKATQDALTKENKEQEAAAKVATVIDETPQLRRVDVDIKSEGAGGEKKKRSFRRLFRRSN